MTLTTCSTKGRRGSHAAERAFHCRRASDLRATRRLAPCCSKTERPGVSMPPSLALALPGAFPLRARTPEHGHHGCHRRARCCQRCCCPSASRCPGTRSLPYTAIAASPRRCNCRPRTAESTMAGWPSSPRRVSTAPSFLVFIRVNHQLRRPLLGLSSPSPALLHRRGRRGRVCTWPGQPGPPLAYLSGHTRVCRLVGAPLQLIRRRRRPQPPESRASATLLCFGQVRKKKDHVHEYDVLQGVK